MQINVLNPILIKYFNSISFSFCKIGLALMCFLFSKVLPAQGSVSATFSLSDIPTSFSAYSASCSGSGPHILEIALPAGDQVPVTSIDVTYTMTALNGGEISQQRSRLRCINNGTAEADYTAGIGSGMGSYTYNRTGLNIANNTYSGGANLKFSIEAFRTSDIIVGCHTAVQKVNVNSWTVTVHYAASQNVPRVDVGTVAQNSRMSVNGKIKVSDDASLPTAGTIRFNATTQDFEGFDGTIWWSLTQKNQAQNWGKQHSIENSSKSQGSGAAFDYFGNSVSVQGDYAVVGASGYASIGRAYVFKKTGTSWSQINELIPSDGAVEDNFGNSVSINGDYAIVGAYRKDVGSNVDQGKAYIFVRNGSNWVQQTMLTAPNGAANDNFGVSVGISGDYAIVGASHHDTFGNLDQGRAYVYVRNGSSWTLMAMLNASDGTALDLFGYSVGISDNFAIVGAYFKNVGSNTNQGKTYVFARSGLNWSQQATLTASDGASGDKFGYSVNIDESFAIVGAYHKDISGNTDQGKVYIYERTGTSWSQQAMLLASDGAANDYFGNSVSIDGDYAVIGAYGHSYGVHFSQGKSYVFKRNGSAWSLDAMLVASDGDSTDNGGNSVSIDANNIIMGAYAKDIGNNPNQGKIYFFKQ